MVSLVQASRKLSTHVLKFQGPEDHTVLMLVFGLSDQGPGAPQLAYKSVEVAGSRGPHFVNMRFETSVTGATGC